VQIFLRDVGHGLLEISHNMLALLGLLLLATLLFGVSRVDLRSSLEQQAYGWLQERNSQRVAEAGFVAMPDDPDGASLARALAVDPATLNRQQATVTGWLARRYRVAPEPVARLVQEAWKVGHDAKLDPTLILAIVAVESSFNPFAQSAVGAQGLMQVMTGIHTEKYEAFGGKLTAFDPVTNLRVGVQVLKECIARAGGLEAGLRFYVGAANLDDDGGYASKVLAEQRHLLNVAAGQQVSVTAPSLAPTAIASGLTAPGPAAGAASAARSPVPEGAGAAPERSREKPATVALAG
jgi:hypothetical protein